VGKPTIVCVDDERSVLEVLKQQLRFNLKGDLSIEVSESAEDALELIDELVAENIEIPVVISDQIMPGIKGDAFLAQVHVSLPRSRKILLTGQATADEVGNAVNNANLYRYISKPWEEIDLNLTVNEAVRSYFQGKDLMEKNQELERKIQTFYKFVPLRFLELLDHKVNFEQIELGVSRECHMAVLFSDIRAFSRLAVRATPHENFTFLNSYLAHMGPIIRKHGGFIDKYIGDAIMGLFESGDPAVQAGIDMLSHLKVFNQIQTERQRGPIAIGIGINSGQVMLGTVGELNRLETTVIGDTVNLAYRLESLTKYYGSSLLISEFTLKGLKKPAQYAIRFVDRALLKGQRTPVKVFEIFNADPPHLKEKKERYLSQFEEAVNLYHQREFESAAGLFHECLGENPEDRAAQRYVERCNAVIRIMNAEPSDDGYGGS